MSGQLPLPHDPHQASSAFTIDPCYSADRMAPDPAGLSLLSRRREGPQWLYAWGACEVYLFNRMRHEAFMVCTNVDHPGRFRSYSPVLFARKKIVVDQPDPAASARLFHCGHADVRVNNNVVFHEAAADAPRVRTVTYGSLLKPGENLISVRIHAMGEPPCFVMLDGPLSSDDQWQVSCDAVVWKTPTCFPFEGGTLFPHRESLPTVVLKPGAVTGDLCDFGVEVLGRPVFSADAAGEVTLVDGETADEARDGDPRHHEQVLSTLRVAAGENAHPHELALRYLRVAASPGVKVSDLRLVSTVYPARYLGAFACSDEELTRVWMHAAYTLRLCMRELFIDGIKRDRLPWVGDLYIGGLCDYFSFFEPHIVRNSLTALYGEEPETVDLSGIIDYSMYWTMALRDYVMHTGDTAFAVRARPYLMRLIKALEGKEDGRGLLPTASLNWLFIDWTELVHEGYSSNLHMLYVMALDAAAQLLSIDGSSDDTRRVSRKAKRLRETCREIFWDDRRKLFADNAVGDQPGGHFTRHAAALAILSGVADERHTPHLLENVLLNPSVPPVGTPYMAAFEARALAKCGRVGEMLDFVRRTWGGMVRAGASTFWEGWDPAAQGAQHYVFYGRPFGKSLCHAWSSGPLFLLSSEAFGARPLEPGWKRFTVDPNPGGLQWMSVAIPTPGGTIKASLDGQELRIQIPEGTVLEVRGDKGRKITLAGPCQARRESGTWRRE